MTPSGGGSARPDRTAFRFDWCVRLSQETVKVTGEENTNITTIRLPDEI